MVSQCAEASQLASKGMVVGVASPPEPMEASVFKSPLGPKRKACGIVAAGAFCRRRAGSWASGLASACINEGAVPGNLAMRWQTSRWNLEPGLWCGKPGQAAKNKSRGA